MKFSEYQIIILKLCNAEKIKDDQFPPLKSTKKLANIFHHYVLAQIELPSHLKDNRHSIWLKNPDQIIKLINRGVKEVKILAY